ncbi:MAG TPA: DsbA family protein [Hyphomicrobiaceae bacterium]|nr:DsbA family protein [Hyphomicrobiaceae bacterium]
MQNIVGTLERWRRDLGSKLGLSEAASKTLIPAAGILVVTLLIAVAATQLWPSEEEAAEMPATVSAENVLKPGDLPDIVIGKPDAKIAIVEYASMTCPHCAAFHTRVLPQLKAKYIDTGKVRLILREFPLDRLAMSAAMLARCVGGEGAELLIDDLFKRQDEWAVRGDATPKLFEVAKQAGFTKASFDACLSDQALYDKILAGRARASDKFGVNSTPTFFVNGQRLGGGATLADFDKTLEPLLKSGS